jgi:predicted alpha/beta superfamily hydrolase
MNWHTKADVIEQRLFLARRATIQTPAPDNRCCTSSTVGVKTRAAGPRELHPGQPDRRRQSQTDDSGHGRRQYQGQDRPGGGGIFSMGDQFTDVMIQDIIPMIDGTYRTLTGREYRAMAGLSMGGMQMFNITLTNLDKFAYIAGFSPGLPMNTINRIYEDPNGFNKKVKVLFLGAGGIERRSNPNFWNLHQALAEAGIESVYYESPGTAHERSTWHRHLREFDPLLFKG